MSGYKKKTLLRKLTEWDVIFRGKGYTITRYPWAKKTEALKAMSKYSRE